jgi:choline/glycine/proline betaine transport protein
MVNKNTAAKTSMPMKNFSVMSTLSPFIVVAFLLFSILRPNYASDLFNQARDFITADLSWYYIGLMNFYLLFIITIAISKYGRIRLGGENDKPEFGYFSWLSMLFGAGMGIGILFWSIAEPITHFQNNPFLEQASTTEASQIAMRLTMLHWGLHGWALYAAVGLILSYFAYRKGLPLTISASLYPILGDRIYGPIGKMADLLAVLGTVFGVATSLGLGAQQMNLSAAPQRFAFQPRS